MSVVRFCTASEHLLVDSSQLVLRLGTALAEARRSQQLDTAALRATHDEELKKVSFQLHILEQLVKEVGGAERKSELGAVPRLSQAQSGSISRFGAGPVWAQHRRGGGSSDSIEVVAHKPPPTGGDGNAM